MNDLLQIHCGDALEVLRTLPDECVQVCVTSPPYFELRAYIPEGHPCKAKEIGMEQTPSEYIAKLVEVFQEVRRLLKPDGLCFVNIGDSYANDGKWGGHTGGKHVRVLHGSPIGRNKRYTGFKPKELIMIPARVAIAMQEDGWWLRQEIVFSKKAPMPESVRDRFTRSHEMVYMLAKSKRYFFDQDSIREPQKTLGDRHEGKSGYRNGHPSKGGIVQRSLHPKGANKKSVWHISPERTSFAHYAVMPSALVLPCILAGSRHGDTVLDPFIGSGTVAKVAIELGRHCIGIDLDARNLPIIKARCAVTPGMF